MARLKHYPQDEIDGISKVMEYILAHQGQSITVGSVRKKFGLTREQYDMIYDLCLPLIRRWTNNDGYWKARYRRFKLRITTALRGDKSELGLKLKDVIATDNELADKLNRQFHMDGSESPDKNDGADEDSIDDEDEESEEDCREEDDVE